MTPGKIKVSISNYYTEMFGECRYFLMPKYQRPYSWEEKHIEDFWNDMVFAIAEAGELPYLLGSIYLAKVGYDQLGEYVNQDILNHEQLKPLAGCNDFYFVIDGQQRTTTFFLFLLAFQDAEINSHLFNAAIPKLIPGKVDYEYFLHLVNGKEVEAKTKSNRRIKATYLYFQRHLANFPRRDDLKRFVQSNIQVVQILVEDDLKLAGTLFVSQTDRGKRLTNTEKLKSTLMFYAQKVEKDIDLEGEIDNLFGGLFETIELLCSLKVYPKPESAEADVIRILNFMLLKEDFYRKYLNDLITGDDDKDRKVDVWYESGEDRIYESINKVFRETLVLQRDNIKLIIPILTDRLRNIIVFMRYVAETAVPGEMAHNHKDPYASKTWYPFKQLFSVLGLSVFSKALLVDIFTNTPLIEQSLLEPGQTFAKKEELASINLFEDIDRIKGANVKLVSLIQESGIARDIELIRPYKELFGFLKDRYMMCLVRIDEFRQFASRPATIFNLIEENELAIWTIGKRPVGSFVWGSNVVDEIIEHVRNFSFWYKKDYLVRDLGYGNYKYVLYEYDRMVYDYTDQELGVIFDYDIDEDDGIMIQREHILAQSAVNYQELKDTWLKSTNENYDDWIWKIGNIALLEHTINIGNAGNKTVWDKADYYLQSSFRGTRALANEIKRMKAQVDTILSSVPDAEKRMIMHLPFKILFEIREMELLAFAFYRFA
ncbi:MAG: DUF262 domain-containing protein [Desulfuromonadales bacterium]